MTTTIHRILSWLAVAGIIALLQSCASAPDDGGAVVAPSAPPAQRPEDRLEEITVSATRSSGSSRQEQLRERRDALEAERQAELQRFDSRSELMRQRVMEQAFSHEAVIHRGVDPSMIFKNYGVNPTVETLEEDTSTFSVDTDTASFSLARAFLRQRSLPDPNGIRVEEFVNSFNYGYSAPAEQLFALQAEAFPSPYRKGFHVLHLGLKAGELSRTSVKPVTLTFLIDVSGSMANGNRLEMVKQALSQLVDALHPQDSISLVAYSTTARLVLEATEVRHAWRIKEAIHSLYPQENTNIAAGLQLAYRIANKSFDPDRVNRIILCSDGVANVGNIDPAGMLEDVGKAARQGIYLTTVGVGMGNYNDVMLETLAQKGEGQYAYIDSPAEAEKLFVEKLAGTLQVVARDVKIQVQFDPQQVARYRLLGYENRGMDNADFTNARKDAAEMGAGHSVTAIYEIKFRDASLGDFGRFRLSYKLPGSEAVRVLDKALPASIVRSHIDQSSAATQLSYISAAFAEKLRGSYWSRTYDYRQLERWLAGIRRAVAAPEQAAELRELIRMADRLDKREDRYRTLVSVQQMSFDQVPVLR